MISDSYQKGSQYEIFIRRAFQCPRGSKNGADASFMQNLIDKEKGKSSVSHLQGSDKQLEKVKGYVVKAFDKFLKNKGFTEEEQMMLTSLKSKAEYAWSSEDLMNTVVQGLTITLRFK